MWCLHSWVVQLSGLDHDTRWGLLVCLDIDYGSDQSLLAGFRRVFQMAKLPHLCGLCHVGLAGQCFRGKINSRTRIARK